MTTQKKMRKKTSDIVDMKPTDDYDNPIITCNDGDVKTGNE